MPTFEITSPEGKKYRVTGDNAEGAYAALNQHIGQSAPQPSSDVALEPGERPLNVFGEGVAPTDLASAIGKEVGKGVSYEFQQPDVSLPQAIGRGATQGATFGLGDEAAGLAAASGLPGPTPLPISADSPANAVPDPWTAISNVARIPIGAARLAAEKIAPSVFGTGATEAADEATTAARVMNDAAYANHPVGYIGGNLAGGAVAAAPAAAAGPVIGGAGIGALYGIGEGTDPQSRLMGGAGGAVIGGAGGAVLGALPRAFTRPAVGPAAGEVAAAAERQGIRVPTAVATDSRVPQILGGLTKNIPFVGQPLKTASQSTINQLGQRAADVAGGLGATTPETAGGIAGDRISNWIEHGSQDVANRLYTQVSNALGANRNMTHPLTEAQGAVADIMTRRTNAGLDPLSPAVRAVQDAITRPGGLTFDGIKDLRTFMGKSVSPLLHTPADKAEYSRLYGALSEDMQNAALRAGGRPAANRLAAANRVYDRISEVRKELGKIVGAKGQASEREIYENIRKLALDNRSESTSRLLLAKQTVGTDAWRGIAGDVIQRLGRDAEDHFSPNLFLRDYGKLSNAAREVLFDGTTRRALDDIAVISSRFKNLQQYANPSGTGQAIAIPAYLAWAFAHPISAATAAIGGGVVSKILSQPATASSMARWSHAYLNFAQRPSAATVAGLQVASRNFGATVADKLGIPGAGEKLFGSVISRAKEQQQNNNPPRQKQEGGR